jgi:uncharacterized protein (TIGR00255 family)
MAEASAIASMTGFARVEERDGEFRDVWEIRSVNGRNLDIRCRLPAGLEALDPVVRAAVPRYCRRGSLSVTLAVDRSAVQHSIRINRPLLDQLLTLAAELQGRSAADSPRLDGLLAVRGVIEVAEPEQDPAHMEARSQRLVQELDHALDQLRLMRLAEGARLAALLEEQLAAIEGICRQAAAGAAAQPAALMARLRKQLATLLDGTTEIAEDRLAQEVALLVAKGDIREELDRLAAHVQAARQLLAEGGAVGRKLDFLCQEFNREANTLCSKAADIELTRCGLALKSAVEQLREQVQNIE